MKLLLDTPIWLWARLEPDRLGPKLRRRLSDPANELWLSPISVWETLVLIERGRIEVTTNPVDWLRAALATGPVRDAPLNRDVAIASRLLDLEHEDPADRFIAASAQVHGLVLATADQRLLRSKQLETVPNR
ncbi:MAG: type II toxin-antitoxin system VapC family toxin [Actinobacteria bacterium]|nr:type II toxin-antitoxin system VapC family toxin [Actinomycetota bacterium]